MAKVATTNVGGWYLLTVLRSEYSAPLVASARRLIDAMHCHEQKNDCGRHAAVNPQAALRGRRYAATATYRRTKVGTLHRPPDDLHRTTQLRGP